MANAGTFKKGGDTRRNTKGRPPKPDFNTEVENLPQAIKDELFKCQITGAPVSPRQFGIIALACRAGEGSDQAIKQWNEHQFGKPKEHVEVEETGRMVIVEELVNASDDTAA